jgi:hypothetical protein
MPSIKTFAVMTHIDGGIAGSVRAETRDDASAENLRQVFQGLLALGRMQNDPKATALMNSLQLSGTGRTVKLSFSVPSELLDMIPTQKRIEGGAEAPEPPKPPKPPVPPTPDR